MTPERQVRIREIVGNLEHPRREPDGTLDLLSYEYIRDSGSAVVGDPQRCVEAAKRYEEVGVDLLLCLVNPYKIPHEQVMQSIELMGREVIPHFS